MNLKQIRKRNNFQVLYQKTHVFISRGKRTNISENVGL